VLPLPLRERAGVGQTERTTNQPLQSTSNPPVGAANPEAVTPSSVRSSRAARAASRHPQVCLRAALFSDSMRPGAAAMPGVRRPSQIRLHFNASQKHRLDGRACRRHRTAQAVRSASSQHSWLLYPYHFRGLIAIPRLPRRAAGAARFPLLAVGTRFGAGRDSRFAQGHAHALVPVHRCERKPVTCQDPTANPGLDV
jgi:hypothetical protein